MIEAGDGTMDDGTTGDGTAEPIAAGLVVAMPPATAGPGWSGGPSVAGAAGALEAEGATGEEAGAEGAAGTAVGERVARGVGNPAFCKVMVALPSGWPTKLGITKA